MCSECWSFALVLLLLVGAVSASPSETTTESENMEQRDDDESDSAPFVVMVRGGTEGTRRCIGALVSERAVLTRAECARGEAVRVRAEGASAERRAVRVALASDFTLAVLEMNAPFDVETSARPIVCATRSNECAEGAHCHAVTAHGDAPRLRIVDATLAPPARCGPRAQVCVTAPAGALCVDELGATVVCGGKLCALVATGACSSVHAALSVVRARQFLQCANIVSACTSGECAHICTERQLERVREVFSRDSASPTPPAGTSAAPPILTNAIAPPRTSTTSSLAATRTTLSAIVTTTMAPQSSLNLEFEPNRADFKAGEYGDNAAQYDSEDTAPHALPAAPELPTAPAPPTAIAHVALQTEHMTQHRLKLAESRASRRRAARLWFASALYIAIIIL